MPLTVRFEAEAALEVLEAQVHLAAEASEATAIAFEECVREALQLLADNPEAGRKVEITEALRVRVRAFPVAPFRYLIVYQVRSQELVVLAVAHTSRRPAYWALRAR